MSEGGEMGMRSELEEMQMKCDQVTDEVSALGLWERRGCHPDMQVYRCTDFEISTPWYTLVRVRHVVKIAP